MSETLSPLSAETLAWLNAANERQTVLESAFKLVQRADNWKGPIDAVVNGNQLTDVIVAIHHFTGGKSLVVPYSANLFRVTSPGYYVCVGA